MPSASLSGLPNELWELISDFAPAGALCRTCHRAWSLLSHRHRQYRVPRSQFAPLLAHLLCDFPMKTLDIRCVENHSDDCVLPGFKALAEMPLQRLSLDLCGVRVGTAGANALAELRRNPRLEVVHLGLCRSAIHQQGVEALARLTSLQTLRVLSLDLSHNGLSGHAVAALAALATAPALHCLQLGLAGNCIQAAGAVALAELCHCPSLRQLRLDLWDNYLGDAGASALACLWRTPTLTALELELGQNGLGDRGVAALAALGAAPTLCCLSLGLGGSSLSSSMEEAGATAVLSEGLRRATALTTLQLDLASCGATDAALDALLSLATMPSLRSLWLDLTGNSISDDATMGRGVAALLEANQLQLLSLGLAGNCCGLKWAGLLERLTALPQLQRINLDLPDNVCGVGSFCPPTSHTATPSPTPELSR